MTTAEATVEASANTGTLIGGMGSTAEEQDASEWEWPSELSHWGDIENILRCAICGEYLRTAVMLPCSHNYCSLCIRRTLEFKMECPTCRQKTVPSDLRPNRSLDSIAKQFAASKAKLLISIGENGQGEDEEDTAADGEENDVPEREQENIEDSEKDNRKRNRGRPKNSATYTAKRQNSDTRKPQRPLPQLCYHLLKDNKLKELLRKLGLPSNGDRDTLIWRHKEYTIIHNAECDNVEPLSLSEIVSLVLSHEVERKNGTRKHMKEKALLGVSSSSSTSWESAIKSSQKLASNFALLAEKAKASMQQKKSVQNYEIETETNEGQQQESLQVSTGDDAASATHNLSSIERCADTEAKAGSLPGTAMEQNDHNHSAVSTATTSNAVNKVAREDSQDSEAANRLEVSPDQKTQPSRRIGETEQVESSSTPVRGFGQSAKRSAPGDSSSSSPSSAKKTKIPLENLSSSRSSSPHSQTLHPLPSSSTGTLTSSPSTRATETDGSTTVAAQVVDVENSATPISPSVPALATKDGKWSCQACTYLNHRTSLRCDMCDTRR